MKKIVFGLMLFFAFATKVSAQVTDEATIKYWYYPAQNIYYNDATGEYWYYDAPTIKWIEVKQLPSTYVVSNADTRYTVYSIL